MAGVAQNAETMTSLQIAEVTGKEHKSVLRDIRNLLKTIEEVGGYSFVPTEYNDIQGRIQPSYMLTKKDCLLLASGYDAKLRAVIINRWEELEAQNKPKVPQTYAEALMLAAKQAQQIEEQQKQIELAAPKVEFFDAVVDSSDTIDMGVVAKTLNMGIGRNKLFDVLRDNKVLMPNNNPMQRYVDAGWFRCVESRYTKPNGDTCINIKTVVFQKGVDGIRKILNKIGYGN